MGLFALAMASAIGVHEATLFAIRTSSDPQVRGLVYKGVLVYSPDQHDYLSPAISFSDGNGWRISGVFGKGAAFLRTPGYSLHYYPMYRLLGEAASLRALRWLHVLLFGLSVVWLHGILRLLLEDRRLALPAAASYAFLPIGLNFLSQAMTEALTPAYALLYLLLLLKGLRAPSGRVACRYFALAGGVFGILVLIRPITGLMGLLLPAYVFDRFRPLGVRRVCGVLLLSLLPPGLMLGAWTARNYAICRCVVPLEARHPDTLGLWYSPAFFALQRFTQCWGGNEEIIHYISPLWDAAIRGDVSKAHAERSLGYWPDDVVTELGRERLLSALNLYQASVARKKDYYGVRALPENYFPEEIAAQEAFVTLTKELKARHPWRSSVGASLRYLGKLVLHSNTSSYPFFQAEYRGSRLLNGLRLTFGALHVLIYLAILPLAFIGWRSEVNRLPYLTTFVIVPCLIATFFTLWFRVLEQRYMLPYLSIMYVGATLVLGRVVRSVRGGGGGSVQPVQLAPEG